MFGTRKTIKGAPRPGNLPPTYTKRLPSLGRYALYLKQSHQNLGNKRENGGAAA